MSNPYMTSYTFWILLLLVVICMYGFGMFAWWWKKIGKATEVYVYVTMLFLGLAISSAEIVWARYLHSMSIEAYKAFITSPAWSIGPGLLLLTVLAIVIRMTKRIFILQHGNSQQIEQELRLMKCPHCGKPCPRWEAEELDRAKKRKENK